MLIHNAIFRLMDVSIINKIVYLLIMELKMEMEIEITMNIKRKIELILRNGSRKEVKLQIIYNELIDCCNTYKINLSSDNIVYMTELLNSQAIF
jgi:hypothetical protein